YSREAGRDPIKKAEAIREIVTSISLIPDPIKRSVYLQETSHLLKIEESVLISELNKILLRDRKKAAEEKRPEPAAEPVPDVSPEVAASTVDPEELQEREMVRLLLNYADSTL